LPLLHLAGVSFLQKFEHSVLLIRRILPLFSISEICHKKAFESWWPVVIGRKSLEIADFSSIIGSPGRKGVEKMAEPKDVVKQIRKATRRKFSADGKIRIVLEGLRGETPISEICRLEGIAASVYYKLTFPI
jgi:hypothetical protein